MLTAAQWFMISGTCTALFGLGLLALALRRPAPPPPAPRPPAARHVPPRSNRPLDRTLMMPRAPHVARSPHGRNPR